MYECCNALTITAIAGQLFECLEKEDVAILAAEFTQLGDTLTSMLTRYEICNTTNEKIPTTEKE